MLLWLLRLTRPTAKDGHQVIVVVAVAVHPRIARVGGRAERVVPRRLRSHTTGVGVASLVLAQTGPEASSRRRARTSPR